MNFIAATDFCRNAIDKSRQGKPAADGMRAGRALCAKTWRAAGFGMHDCALTASDDLARNVQGSFEINFWSRQMPMRGELPAVMTRSHPRTSAEGSAGSRVGAVIFNPDLHAILVFCAIGLLATVNAVLWFPDFGGMVAQLAQFP